MNHSLGMLLLTEQHNRMISMLQMLILMMSITLGVSPQIEWSKIVGTQLHLVQLVG